MYHFVIRRVVTIIVMLFAVSIVVFLLFFVSPNDPAAYTCQQRCTPQIIKANRHALGLDKPITVQYGKFVSGIFVGAKFPDDPVIEKRAPQTVTHCPAPSLGYSFRYQDCVTAEVAKRFPITLSIAVGAFVLWIAFGVGIGVLAALRRGKATDRVGTGVSLIVYSLPTFFIGLTLNNIVSAKYGWLPQPQYIPFTENPVQWAGGLIAPWITLAATFAALYVRLTRASMIETLSEDFVRTARSKGLARGKVVLKHALRAALTPIVTIAGLDLGTVIAGAAITESVFNMDGVGKLAVDSILQTDLPVITATVLLAASVVLFFNFVVDILYAVIDPRVRLT
ncbi:MAG: ABC transporter permease [Acidothermales bacterium]|nr:ABC transporter permease [Acidothermales bacterium]